MRERAAEMGVTGDHEDVLMYMLSMEIKDNTQDEEDVNGAPEAAEPFEHCQFEIV